MPPEQSERPARASPPGARSLRFLFYSHDGLGLGHVRRNLCVANALSELVPGASILVATSAAEAELFGIPPGVDLLKLPGVRKVDNGRYAPRRLSMRSEEIHGLRAELLAATVGSFRPAVMLVDKHPFGVGGELLPALEAAREAGTRTVLGLRDVLDDPAIVRDEWHEGRVFERIPKYFDRLLVYGQREVLDPRRAYDFPAPVAALTRFCGYVASSARTDGAWEDGIPPPAGDRPLVLATAGGGEDGFALLSTFIEAAAGRRWQAVAVSGPQCPAERVQRLRTQAALAGVAFRRFVPKISIAFPSADVLVSMGGYGTLVEAAASGVPTICIPRVRPRREQLIRARAFADLGLLRLVESERLDAELLRSEIEHAPAHRDDAADRGSFLDLGGAARAARHLSALAVEAGRERGRTRSVVA
jgi:predicted glycosyltransferase